MKNYWSCSTFADWIRGKPRPECATSEEWAEWEKNAKNSGFRYWLAEEGLDHLQNIFCSPVTLINSIRCYIRNRFSTKTHALTSNLKRGVWHEWDDRILYCLFDELVNFVEKELCYEYRLYSEEAREKYKKPWHQRYLRLGLWRCPKAGLDYLNLASGFRYKEGALSQGDPRIGSPTPQALAAQEILALYHWWKIQRPKRPDSENVNGYIAYCAEIGKKIDNLYPQSNFIGPDKQYEINLSGTRLLLDESDKIEEAYDNEDTEMLTRLIKIRHSLWT